jgi:hypothetical protein
VTQDAIQDTFNNVFLCLLISFSTQNQFTLERGSPSGQLTNFDSQVQLMPTSRQLKKMIPMALHKSASLFKSSLSRFIQKNFNSSTIPEQ